MEFLIASLVVLLMVSVAVNTYLFGKMSATRPIETIRPPEVPKEAAMTFGVPSIPRQPNTETGRGHRYQTGRKIVSPSEAIARDRAQKDGLVPTQQQPTVPAAVRNEFLKDAGAVVASSAN